MIKIPELVTRKVTSSWLFLTRFSKSKIPDPLIQSVTNSFWRIGSPSFGGNLHSTDDTNNSDDEEDNDYQTITLETENVEEEIDEPELIDLEIDKNLDIHIVIDIE